MIGMSHPGIPPGTRFLKCWTTPCSRIPPSWIVTNAISASAAVTEIFPVADAIPGIRPSRLQPRMKKNVVRR